MSVKSVFKCAVAVILAALFVIMAGCGPDPFYIRVAFIEGVPETGEAGTPLALTGTVRPAFASNKDIVWSVKNAGTTEAVINGNILEAAATGTVTIRAVIANGMAEGKDYTQEFVIVFTTPRIITGIAVKTQPTKLEYSEGEPLDLSDLVATLAFDDNSAEDIGLAEFAARGITTDPKQGTVLSLAHNRKPVVVSAGGYSASTNTLTVSEGTTTVPVTGVTLNKSTLLLTVGDIETLTAAIAPANAANQAVSWTSSDPSVAAVTNGTVSALAAGTATIIVTTADGGKKAECTVTVSPSGNNVAKIASTGQEYATLNEAIEAASTIGTSADNHTEIILLKDITVPETVMAAATGYTISKNIKLTFQGSRTITASAGSFSLFTISDADSSLTLEGSNGGSLTLSGMGEDAMPNRRGVYVNSGVFIMNGNITIKGFKNNNNNNNNGGGVYVAADGTFTMSNNSAIEDNSANNGGGVYVDQNGKFSMSGGTIANNYASNGGGGVYVGGEFTMSGGTIANNDALYDGGGVYIRQSGTFQMDDGVIDKNTVTNSGGGVCVSQGATFTMKKSKISNNTAYSNSGNGTGSGGGVYVYGGTFNMNDNTVIENNQSFNGCGVYITSQGSTGGTFTMNDNAAIKNNTSIFPNNASINGGGVYVTGTNTIFTMNSGEISGNTVNSYSLNNGNGGGVYVGQNGTFNMSGGNIMSNSANNQGGGVYQASGTFTMSGGKIYGIDEQNTNKAPNGDASDSGATLFKAGGTAQYSDGNLIDTTNDTLTGH